MEYDVENISEKGTDKKCHLWHRGGKLWFMRYAVRAYKPLQCLKYKSLATWKVCADRINMLWKNQWIQRGVTFLQECHVMGKEGEVARIRAVQQVSYTEAVQIAEDTSSKHSQTSWRVSSQTFSISPCPSP